MKKITALIICILLMATGTASVFAMENGAQVTMTTRAETLFYPGNVIRVECIINNPFEAMNASVDFYLDGEIVPVGGDAQSFVAQGETVRCFEYAIPENSIQLYQHNLMAVLVCANGQSVYCSNVFDLVDYEKFLSLKQISALVIPATINYDVNAYANASLSGYVTTIPKGTVVEYMNPNNHNAMSRAKVKLSDSGVVCWVPMSAVSISQENYTIADHLTDSDREAFVNGAGYSSKTPYLIWVNKERQRLTVFLGSQGNWKAVKTYPVATGKNSTPTPTTVCEYTQYQRWYAPTYICDPVLSLYDGYAIHNQPVNYRGVVPDTTIGSPASAGCVRMLIDDVKWLYYYVPVGTTVVLY